MKKQIILIWCAIIPINFFAMEKPPQLLPVYGLVSSDNLEFIVHAKFLENSEPLKTIFTGKFKESQQNRFRVSLPGAAIETLVNLMHLDQINDEKGLTDSECFRRLTTVLHADSKRGEYILDLLAHANEWMVCPMITNVLATEAAELIFHDEQARAECMQKMSAQDQLYLLDKFSLASHHARNYIPALTVLHGMKNNKEITQDHELDKEWKWSVRCFLVAALDHVREWAVQSGAQQVAQFIESSVMKEMDPHFKDNLYQKLEDLETVDSATVHAMDRIDDTHVVYGGENTAGILDLDTHKVTGFEDALAEANPMGPVGNDPIRINALACLNSDRLIISQQFYTRAGHSLDVTHTRGHMIKREWLNNSLRFILSLGNKRIAVVRRALSNRVNSLDNPITLFDSDNLKEIRCYLGNTAQINCLLQMEKNLISGDHDGTLRVWDLDQEASSVFARADCTLQFGCPIYSLLHLGGHYVVSFGHNCAIWDIEKGENVTKKIGSQFSLVSCDGANNTYGGKATIARKGEKDFSLENLLEKISNIPNLQTVIPFNRDHLLAVYDKHESGFAEPMHAAIRLWNIHDGRMVSDQLIEKNSIASIICADNKIIYGTTTGLMVKHVPQAYPSLTALLERLTLQKP